MVTSENSSSRDPRRWFPLIGAIMLVVGIFVGLQIASGLDSPIHKRNLEDERQLSILKLDQVYNYIDHRYVDSVGFVDLTDQAIRDALKALDPHSYYVSTTEVKDFNDRLDGYYYGLGIETLEIDGRLLIKRIYPGTPADQAELQMGDEIIAVDGLQIDGDHTLGIAGLTSNFTSYLTQEVRLTIRPTGSEDVEEKVLSKARIEVPTVEASHMLTEDIGYIRITRFSQETYREVMKALEQLCEKQGMEHLIIDLRDNPGGYLRQVVEILSQLYDKEDIVLVSTEGVNSKLIEYKSTGKRFYPIDKIAVLINGISASGSEVLAGAIQDTDRGIIVGSTSFGKGLVQERYELIDGSEIRLTTSRYFTPSGRSIQKKYPSNSDIKTEPKAVFQSTNGRKLESYCGIVPDIFVPDTLWTETMENAFLSCYYLSDQISQDRQEANVALCLEQELTMEIDSALINYRTILAQMPPDQAWKKLCESDPAVQAAVDYISESDKFETVLRPE